jgi:hypothetical protein
MRETYKGYQYNKIAEQFEIDEKIRYPSYKSMDEFIDIERLKSLDSLLRKAITEYLKNPPKEEYLKSPLAPKDHFYAGITLKPWQPKINQSHVIFLAKHIGKYNYKDIKNPQMWEFTPFAAQLPEVMLFIKTLPFKATSRIMLMFDTGENYVNPHRDHINPNLCQEFIWFRTNFKKKFYVYHSGITEYISSYSAWFDTVNQFHGAEPAGELNFSIRVDGIFNDELRKLIPKPTINAASTPSFWATVDIEKSGERF